MSNIVRSLDYYDESEMAGVFSASWTAFAQRKVVSQLEGTTVSLPMNYYKEAILGDHHEFNRSAPLFACDLYENTQRFYMKLVMEQLPTVVKCLHIGRILGVGPWGEKSFFWG